jgi:hypothetical protein
MLLYLLCIIVSAVPCHSLDFFQDIGFRGAALLSRREEFENKPQGSAFVEIQNTLSGANFAAALSLGYHSVRPSNLDGGWGYRGFEGFHLWLGAEWYFLNQEHSLSPPPRFGLSLALGGFYSMYQYTDILFFYTALRMNIFADLFFSYPFHLRIGLPTEIYFRRDLDSSFATGIGVWAGISWGRLVGGDS